MSTENSKNKEVKDLDFVIIRTDTAGVHMGYLEKTKRNGSGHYAVTLRNTRRIWSWKGANCLSNLAQIGTKDPDGCNISIAVDKNKLMAIEIISVSENAKANLEAVKDWIVA